MNFLQMSKSLNVRALLIYIGATQHEFWMTPHVNGLFWLDKFVGISLHIRGIIFISSLKGMHHVSWMPAASRLLDYCCDLCYTFYVIYTLSRILIQYIQLIRACVWQIFSYHSCILHITCSFIVFFLIYKNQLWPIAVPPFHVHFWRRGSYLHNKSHFLGS